MTKEFIPYEQALALKELDFDEYCFGIWAAGQLVIGDDISEYPKNVESLAPLYQQAFRWFREKYSLISYVHPLALLKDTKKWCYEITNFDSSWDEDYDLHTLEEADLACLNKLIEIVNNS